jgi:RNA polymerase-binding transcription factor DksA
MTTPLRTQHSAAHKTGPRLQQEINLALSRLRHLGGHVVVEELSGAIGDNSPFADEVDDIQATASRDIGLATRGLLVKRMNRLSDALRRLHDGEYGVCMECGAAVSAARLQVMPEAQTCVRCQEAIERRGRQLDQSPRSQFARSEDGGTSAVRPASVPLSFLYNEEHRDASSLRFLTAGR